MQCYRPINISNRKLAYKSGFDKPSLMAPCGQCYACQSSLQNDWTIRAYFHWRYYRSIGGRTLFITNTYRQNDDPIFGKKSIPIRHFYSNKSGSRKRVNFPCFSKEHIDTYINSIRKYFRRKYGIGKNSSDTSINYLVCCEYGSTEGKTHAPHYHIFLYFPPCPASNQEIKDKCDELWSHGFSLYTPLVDGGAFVNTVYAIKYVSKYCCKDLAYFSRPEVVELLESKKRKKYFKHSLPRHWQSNGFGSSMALYLKSCDNPFESLISGVRMECDLFRYNVPLYVRNKLIYDIYYLKDEKGNILHTLRKLNDFGYKFRSYEYDQKLSRSEALLRVNMTAVGLSRFFSDSEDVRSWYRGFFHDEPSKDYNVQDLKVYLNELLQPYCVKDLAKYSIVFRGHVESDLTCDCFSPSDVLDSAKDVYMLRSLDDFKNVYTFADLTNPDLRDVGRSQSLVYRFETFSDFERILLVLDDLKRRLSQFKSEAAHEQYIKYKKVRDKYKYR